MTAPIRVLVVDDSAFARKVMREVLSADPAIEVVGIARDGLDALEMIGTHRPDVITLDLLMPNLDGLGVLQALRVARGPRVVVVSTNDEESDLVIQALQAGAVEFVHKPTALATDRLYELAAELVAKVKIAGAAKPPPSSPPPVAPAEAKASLEATSAINAVVIGTSTGGPQALTQLLAGLPRDLRVPVGIVLHIPIGYTSALARRLDELSPMDVVEASEGLTLRPGLVVLARAGIHMRLVREEDVVRVRLDVAPLGTPHRPSVDVLFESAAQAYRAEVLGVVLTGMGQDGLQGARALHEAGGTIFTESPSSCVVYGMPRAVAEAGLSHRSVPLDRMAAAIKRAL